MCLTAVLVSSGRDADTPFLPHAAVAWASTEVGTMSVTSPHGCLRPPTFALTCRLRAAAGQRGLGRVPVLGAGAWTSTCLRPNRVCYTAVWVSHLSSAGTATAGATASTPARSPSGVGWAPAPKDTGKRTPWSHVALEDASAGSRACSGGGAAAGGKPAWVLTSQVASLITASVRNVCCWSEGVKPQECVGQGAAHACGVSVQRGRPATRPGSARQRPACSWV